jgi:hypothetical protein
MGGNMRDRGPEPPQFLSGWKEIANYLGKGVRTVQRYERQMGLPVRRPAGKPRGSVVATRVELDAWISASPIREAFRLPSPGCKYAASAEAIKTGIQEMRKLREQMVVLRSEWRTSVSMLRQSIGSLRADLKQDDFKQTDLKRNDLRVNDWPEPGPKSGFAFLQLDSSTTAAGSLDTSGKRKAS